MESTATSSSTATTAESCRRCAEHVELRGGNVGASMSFLPGSTVKPKDGFCINIYVNNNVQGVNNSLLMGSEVKMGDGGVRIYLHGLNKRFKKKKHSKKNDNAPPATSGFLWMLVISFFAFLLLLSFS